MMKRPALATGVVAGLATAGIALAPASAAGAPTGAAGARDYSTSPAHRAYFAQKLVWSPRTCKKTAPGMACARVRVPKDWSRPSLGSLHIVISRPAKGPYKGRLLLTNPGGPGLPGLTTSGTAMETQNLARTHTPIGIDPRGVGLSTTQTCPGLARLSARMGARDPRDVTTAELTRFARQRAQVMARCYRAKGSILRFIDTPSAIRDAVLVIHLTGHTRADYWGGSYGSWYGTVAARMYPGTFARVVVDATAEFSQPSLNRVAAQQPQSMQRSYDQAFLPWAARHNDELGMGTDAVAVEATIERMREAAGAGVFGPKIGRATIDKIRFYSARDLQQSSPVLATIYAGLRKAMDGDTSALDRARSGAIQLAGPVDVVAPDIPGVWEANTAYVCNDSGPGASVEHTVAVAVAQSRRYPLLSAMQIMGVCSDWPGRARWTAADVRRPLRGVVMSQTENDAATGYTGARRARFGSRGLVRMALLDDGSSHGASYDPCVTRVTHAYLATGRFPRRDVHCQAGPLVGDRYTYEFGAPATKARPLPPLAPYLVRDLTMPAIDRSAPSDPHPEPVIPAP